MNWQIIVLVAALVLDLVITFAALRRHAAQLREHQGRLAEQEKVLSAMARTVYTMASRRPS